MLSEVPEGRVFKRKLEGWETAHFNCVSNHKTVGICVYVYSPRALAFFKRVVFFSYSLSQLKAFVK